MEIEKRLKNHYRRWNIEFNSQEQFVKFKYRLIDIIYQEIYSFSFNNVEKFDKLDCSFKRMFMLHKPDKPEIETSIYKIIENCKNLSELATVFQILFWVLENQGDETQQMASEIVKEIRKVSQLTPSASFVVKKRGKQFILYPPGDPFLDKEIIDYTLVGLEHYPKAAKYFEKALKIYLHGETDKYRELLDNLRFSLEQLLKKILDNDKSLEKQNKILYDYLKNKGLQPPVRNFFDLIFNKQNTYYNDASKHNDNYSLYDIEFMIYFTGNFIRLLLKLEDV